MSYNKETGLYEGFIYCITNTVNGKMYIGQTRMTVEQRWASHITSSKKDEKPLYRAIRKYGLEKFAVETIFALSSKTKEMLKHTLNFCEMYFIGKYKTLIFENGYNLTRGGDSNGFDYMKPVKQYDLQLNYIQSYESISEASVKTGIDTTAIRQNCHHNQQTGGGYIWCFANDEPVKPQYHLEYNIDNVDISKYNSDDLIKLMIMGWGGRRIFQYNMFGEVINVFDDPMESAKKLGYDVKQTYLYVSSNRHYNNTKLLYEGDDFKEYTKSSRVKPVSMYDDKGNFIMRFLHSAEADKYLGVKNGNVKRAIKKHSHVKGYRFAYYGEELIIKKTNNNIPIDMVDKEGNVIKSFDCIKDIGRQFNVGSMDRKIKSIIQNHILWNGFYWRYKDEVAVM